ncbi:hypothetical protein [Agriterribacter sp.]|uniref:hypothetical protein n=1 Tax=Agriterribacter sp. TaxID=2821509 RepID=UPI002B51220C|nr:hypothetical protein [Agriterribacter sp.]HRO46958.1 hypothetical protein [Agriterribacter sp.]HRQ18991.1 hypothetical protein [Agriterribacter sp.]
MQYLGLALCCRHCFSEMPAGAFFESDRLFGYRLCASCYSLLKEKVHFVSEQAFALYLALKENGISAELEKSDGFKKVDIAVDEVNLHIEVDGQHHHIYEQALTDLKRTIYSLQNEFITIRIPNALIDQNLSQTRDELSGIIRFRQRKAG